MPEDGEYRVLASWVDADLNASNAPYTVSAGGQELADVRVNQREKGGAWVEIASVPLKASTACEVTLTNDADGVVVADPIRAVLVTPTAG